MKQRLLSGVAAAAVFVGVLLFGGYLYGAAVLLLAILGFREFTAMHKLGWFSPGSWLGYAAVLLLTVPWSHYWPGAAHLFAFQPVVWYLLFTLLLLTVISKNKFTHQDASIVFIGAVYIGMGFHYMWLTRTMIHGLFWTLTIFACIWANDSGAYFTGRSFGRTKLWPAISPNKTVEGAVGGILLSVAAALLFAWIYPGLLSFPKAVWTGFWIAVVGQAGDLIESAYKRVCGVKDSGSLLPGHGGALDRMDSWIIVFAFLHLTSLIG